MTRIDEHQGRALFGLNPAGYDAVRPPYPAAFFSLLVDQGALFEGAATLEIGPGNGLATQALLAHGARPLTVVEPEKAFEGLLRARAAQAGCALRFINAAFEEAVLPAASFDLVVAATMFHWLDPGTRVQKLAELLAPAGHVALMWNGFQSPHRPNPIDEATKELVAHLAASPAGAPGAVPFSLDRTARHAEFLQTGWFELRAYLEIHWTLELGATQLGLLYEGFSPIARLPETERTALIARVVEVAERQFGGVVEQHMTSPLYLFRRR